MLNCTIARTHVLLISVDSSEVHSTRQVRSQRPGKKRPLEGHFHAFSNDLSRPRKSLVFIFTVIEIDQPYPPLTKGYVVLGQAQQRPLSVKQDITHGCLGGGPDPDRQTRVSRPHDVAMPPSVPGEVFVRFLSYIFIAKWCIYLPLWWVKYMHETHLGQTSLGRRGGGGSEG